MTIDEAIKEFTDWAKDNRQEQNYWATERNESYDETNPLSYANCEGFERDAEERAEYHEQLAEWLTELKDLREENKVLTRDCLRLIKSNDKLRKKVKVIAKYKRLLKAAVNDMRDVANNSSCSRCVFDELDIQGSCCAEGCFKWRYADEALRLLNDEKINNVE